MDVARMDKPTSWAMLKNEISFIKANPGACKTLVIDTIDWAEQLAVDYVCSTAPEKQDRRFWLGQGLYIRTGRDRALIE